MALIIATETRALWLAGAVEDSTWSGRPHIGLDVWSPNINIQRAPQWGRNTEAASEDPMINGQHGIAYTLGVQNGEDSRFLKLVGRWCTRLMSQTQSLIAFCKYTLECTVYGRLADA